MPVHVCEVVGRHARDGDNSRGGKFGELDMMQRCHSIIALSVVFGENYLLVEESNCKTLDKKPP